jgi:hypothetical protein
MILVDDAQQIWRIQPEEFEYIISGAHLELRVGGVLWRKVDADPQQGEWAIIDVPWHPGCAIQLGSPTLGWPIECHPADAHDRWRAVNE